MTRAERLKVAERRIPNILRRHAVAPMRTLEQKISDAGPNNQRVDPHLLTEARNTLTQKGTIAAIRRRNLPWYRLTSTGQDDVQRRLEQLGPLHDRTAGSELSSRVGQTLEIAVFRALHAQRSRHGLFFFGGFADLDEHDDSTMYSKLEPPRMINGQAIPGDLSLDFIVVHPEAGLAGIEAKNVREWMYPDRDEIRDLLLKCCHLNAIPVLIARRIAYSTFSILHTAGVVVHQVYNQLYPFADAEFADLIRHKDNLGYHDVRVGNAPDRRLLKFIGEDLPSVLPLARPKFEEYSDLLLRFGRGEIGYPEFAGRLRRRQRGEPEDGPPPGGWESPF